MRFFIESHTILKNRSGVGWAAHGLVRGLTAQLRPQDSIHLLTHPKEPMDVTGLLGEQVYDVPIDWMPPQLYHALKFRNRMPPIDLMYGKGLYIFPNYIRWPIARQPTVIMVHDLSLLVYPEFFSADNYKLMSTHMPPSIEKADMIISVSENTKKDLMRFYNVPEEKIVVALQSVGDGYYPRSHDEVAHVKARYGIFGDYLLFISNLEPRKNVEGIIAAFRALPDSLRNTLSLVLVGGNGWQNETILAAIEDARLAGDRIIRPGYILEEDKPALVSGSTAFLYPSHYEGFGMPVLEGLGCGVPVLTANNSSLPEVVGDAALLVDSWDNKEMAEGLERIIVDTKLREKLIKAGPKQAARFSWDSFGQKVMAGLVDRGLVS